MVVNNDSLVNMFLQPIIIYFINFTIDFVDYQTY